MQLRSLLQLTVTDGSSCEMTLLQKLETPPPIALNLIISLYQPTFDQEQGIIITAGVLRAQAT